MIGHKEGNRLFNLLSSIPLEDRITFTQIISVFSILCGVVTNDTLRLLYDACDVYDTGILSFERLIEFSGNILVGRMGKWESWQYYDNVCEQLRKLMKLCLDLESKGEHLQFNDFRNFIYQSKHLHRLFKSKGSIRFALKRFVPPLPKDQLDLLSNSHGSIKVERRKPILGMAFRPSCLDLGLLVTKVHPNTAAHHADIRKGDIIQEIDGIKVSRKKDVFAIYPILYPGQSKKLTIKICRRTPPFSTETKESQHPENFSMSLKDKIAILNVVVYLSDKCPEKKKY